MPNTVMLKETEGQSLGFEPQWEALQFSRNNCQIPGKPGYMQVGATS